MTNRDERYLKERVGRNNPFSVPEGYFDDFATRLMESLPEQECQMAEVRPLRRRFGVRTLFYAAACLCVAMLATALYFNKVAASGALGDKPDVAQQTAPTGTDSYVDAVADYAMMDNTDIYAYLSDE